MVPELIVNLETVTAPLRKTWLLPATMVTVSVVPGTPFGLQLVAVVHAVDAFPVHVYVAAFALWIISRLTNNVSVVKSLLVMRVLVEFFKG